MRDEEFLVVFLLILLGAVVLCGIAAFIMSIIALKSISDLRRQILRLGYPIRPREVRPEPAPAPARPPEPALPPAPPAIPVPPAEPARPVPAAAPAPVGAVAPALARPAAAAAGWQGMEATIGKRWLTWAGGLAVFLATGFFVKHAIDNQWIGATGRVTLGIIFGLALIAIGDVCFRRKMQALGQGLIGAGLACVYVSLYAAFSFYHLLPQGAAFAAMIAVTVAGVTLAVLHDALALAVLALIGGLLTPVMLSTGRDSRDTLFGYLTLLDLGVLGVALFRRWRSLDCIAFFGTIALFIAWYQRFYTSEAMVPALLWAGGFFVIFLILPFLYSIRHGTPATIERFLLALANATWSFATAYAILHDDHRHALGFVALGMAAAYVAMGAIVRRRMAQDLPSIFGFIALAMTFLTIAIPLHLRVRGILLGWAAEGAVLLYLGYRFRYLPVRIGGLIVLAIATIRLFVSHWPLHEESFRLFWNVRFATALCVPLAGAAYAFIHHLNRKDATPTDRGLQATSGIAAGFLALIILHAELALWFADWEWRTHGVRSWYTSLCVGILVWTTGATAFLGAGLRLRSLATRLTGLVALAIALTIALFLAYDGRPRDWGLVALNPRFLASLAAVLLVFAYGIAIDRARSIVRPDEIRAVPIFLWAGTVLLFILLSIEIHGYFRRIIEDPRHARWVAQMALSILWGAYASVLLILGFARNWRPVRLAALGLFGLTAAKLVIVDLASLDQMYRVLSFLAIGLLMIVGAYLYHRAEKRLAVSEAKG